MKGDGKSEKGKGKEKNIVFLSWAPQAGDPLRNPARRTRLNTKRTPPRGGGANPY